LYFFNKIYLLGFLIFGGQSFLHLWLILLKLRPTFDTLLKQAYAHDLG